MLFNWVQPLFNRYAQRCAKGVTRGAKWPGTPQKRNNTLSGHTGEQESGGPGHGTRKATHGNGTPVNRGKVAQDMAQAKQHTEQAHR